MYIWNLTSPAAPLLKVGLLCKDGSAGALIKGLASSPRRAAAALWKSFILQQPGLVLSLLECMWQCGFCLINVILDWMGWFESLQTTLKGVTKVKINYDKYYRKFSLVFGSCQIAFKGLFPYFPKLSEVHWDIFLMHSNLEYILSAK